MESHFKLDIGEIITSDICSAAEHLIILEGKVRILRKNALGKEETIGFLQKDDVLSNQFLEDKDLKFIASGELILESSTNSSANDLDTYLGRTINKIRNSIDNSVTNSLSTLLSISAKEKHFDNQEESQNGNTKCNAEPIINSISNSSKELIKSESIFHKQEKHIPKNDIDNDKTSQKKDNKSNNASEVLNEVLTYFESYGNSDAILYKAKNIDELAQNIKSFGFDIEISTCNKTNLSEAKLPFILQDHTGKFCWIVNKKKDVFIQKLNNHISPIEFLNDDESTEYLIIQLSPKSIEKEEKPYNLDWYFDFIRNNWNLSTQMLIASIFVQFVAISSPIFYMVIFDRVFGHQNLHTLDIMTWGMIILTVFDLTVKVVKSYVLSYQLELLDKAGYKSLLQRIFSIPLAKSSGELTKSFSQSISEFSKTNQTLLNTILVSSLDVFFAILLFGVLLCINAPLTLISMITLIPISIITFCVAPGMQKRALEYNKQQRAYQLKLSEALESPETVKSISAGKHLERSLTQQAIHTFENGFKARFDQVNGGNLIGFLGNLGSIITLYYGAHEVLAGRVSYGAYLAINMMSKNLIGSFQKLFGSIQQFQGALSSLELLKTVYQEDSESHSNNGIRLDALKGDIKIVDLDFKYNAQAPLVLKNINLEIKAGSKVILTGKSGAGKTSLIRLLQRLYEPNSGYILLDNFNVANIELDDLRKQVGVALQKPFLYAGTIKENISLGQPSAPMREITEVATMAQLDQFLLKTPKGFDSPVTSMGNNLSGGQAARIALARVLLRKPSVLILDEALASLDQSLTGSIFSLLLERYKKSTCIFVTDYLPLHAQSDQIIVMHEGEIVEQGTYNELVNARAYYYHLLATELEAAK